MDDLTADLSGVSFFNICSREQLGLLGFSSERCYYEPGDVVYAAGDIADGAFVLVEGTVNITDIDRPDGAGYSAQGPDLILGAMALLLERPRIRTVVAISQLDMIFVPRVAFGKLLKQYPDLAAATAERIKQEMGGYVTALNKFQDK